MPAPILAAKLYVPPAQPAAVTRSRLIEHLDEGLHRRLTLVSAAAGFGKTTILGEWVTGSGRPVAWLSLDDGDSDPARFLAYLVAALQTIDIGEGCRKCSTPHNHRLPKRSLRSCSMNLPPS
jgi:LuxR family transcriptional regulator, maltose regulon positive regulatory protein